MQKVAQFIQRGLAWKGIEIIMYIDDALIIAPHDQDPHALLSEVMHVIRSLGLPLAYEKIQSPMHRCRFLSIIIDIKRRQIEIPQEKIQSFLESIRHINKRDYMSKARLQSLIGSINHLAKAVQGARLFMNRFLDSLRGMVSDRICVDQKLMRDIDWFKQFLPLFNGKAIINDGQPVLSIKADSCLIGGGGTDGRFAYMYQYPENMSGSFHITQLEAINCLLAV